MCGSPRPLRSQARAPAPHLTSRALIPAPAQRTRAVDGSPLRARGGGEEGQRDRARAGVSVRSYTRTPRASPCARTGSVSCTTASSRRPIKVTAPDVCRLRARARSACEGRVCATRCARWCRASRSRRPPVAAGRAARQWRRSGSATRRTGCGACGRRGKGRGRARGTARAQRLRFGAHARPRKPAIAPAPSSPQEFVGLLLRVEPDDAPKLLDPHAPRG